MINFFKNFSTLPFRVINDKNRVKNTQLKVLEALLTLKKQHFHAAIFEFFLPIIYALLFPYFYTEKGDRIIYPPILDVKVQIL